MNKILTTYFSKIKNIPEDYTGLVISRFPPKWLDIRGNPKLYHVTELSPHKDILFEYKNNKDWDRYVERFSNQMKNDEEFNRVISNMVNAIENKGKKYCLICYEKDYTHCHRSLIAWFIKENYKIDWEEIS